MSKRPIKQIAADQLRIIAEALEAGDLQRAERDLAPLTNSWPGHAEVLRLQAIAQDMRGMHRDALHAMRRALALCPDDASCHNTMATVLGNAGEIDAAVAELRRACALQPTLAIAWYNLGIMLSRSVHHDDALVAFRHAVALEPGHVDARTRLADILRNRGQIEAATAEYRHVLSERPSAGVAWQGLSDLKTVRFAEADIASMQSALADPEAGNNDKVAIGFALARALDDAGRYPEALIALERAKNIARQQTTWNAARFSNTISALHAAFAPPPSGADARELGREVIFIVGLPRSGTTLVEQILASHPQVAGTGELPDVKSVLVTESRRRDTPFPDWVHSARPDDWSRMGRFYLERTKHWRKKRPVSTDKLPNNWIYAGAIMAMLPSSHIVCCRRDPLETCFSCYRQYRDNQEYTSTFSDLASFWRDYDRSVELWHSQYPGQVYEHSYERLLADPETSVRRLLEFCNLPWEPRCLRFYDNRREVRSPSATQVREPLHADAARASRYANLLDPLRAELAL